MPKPKIRYSDIELVKVEFVDGHEYLYFEAGGEDDSQFYYEWQRGARGINVKWAPEYDSPDVNYFSMDYSSPRPTLRQAKSCIQTYLNERDER